MIIAVWIASGLLALAYLAAGGMKTFRPMAALAEMMPWTVSAGAAATRAIGILEILGAIGVILPHLTGIAPWLSVVAAFGLVLVQVSAIVLHVARKDDPKGLVANVVLLLLAAFVGVGLLIVL